MERKIKIRLRLVIIKNEKGEILTLYRLKKPQGLALPSGHVNRKEGSIKAAIRETKEETGIVILRLKLVLHEVFENACSKHDFHEWFVYEVIKWEGKLQNKEPRKHSFVKFMEEREMNIWDDADDVDPVWFLEILPRLKMIGLTK